MEGRACRLAPAKSLDKKLLRQLLLLHQQVRAPHTGLLGGTGSSWNASAAALDLFEATVHNMQRVLP